MQRGVAKGLKVPCIFMIAEVSILCQKNPEVGIHHCLYWQNMIILAEFNFYWQNITSIGRI